MKSLLLKLLLPDAECISTIIAQTICKYVNNSGKQAEISIAIEKAEVVVELQQRIAQWLADGKISEAEEKELADQLKPLCETVCKKIKEGL